MSPEPIPFSPKQGDAHIAVRLVLGGTSWTVLIAGVMFAVRLVR